MHGTHITIMSLFNVDSIIDIFINFQYGHFNKTNTSIERNNHYNRNIKQNTSNPPITIVLTRAVAGS